MDWVGGLTALGNGLVFAMLAFTSGRVAQKLNIRMFWPVHSICAVAVYFSLLYGMVAILEFRNEFAPSAFTLGVRVGLVVLAANVASGMIVMYKSLVGGNNDN